MARDEMFLFDLWVHKDFRRHAVGITMSFEMGAAVDEFFPDIRWVYGYAHTDNEASMNLMWLIYGMWTVQTVKEYQVGSHRVGIVPGSDSPKFGPFSKKGRHSGDGFQMPGRPRSGEGYRDYHHPEGFARRSTRGSNIEVADDWMWPGPEWFDNDHPVGKRRAPGHPRDAATGARDLTRPEPGDGGAAQLRCSPHSVLSAPAPAPRPGVLARRNRLGARHAADRRVAPERERIDRHVVAVDVLLDLGGGPGRQRVDLDQAPQVPADDRCAGP